MSDDADRLLMAFMEGTLDEEGAARLLERLDADPRFLESAIRHWRMDRLLETGSGHADEEGEALRRSVRIHLEGSPVESAALSRQVATRLRAMRGGRRSRPSSVHPVAWAAGGVIAAALLIAVTLSLSDGGTVVVPKAPEPPQRTATVPPIPPKIDPVPVPAPPAIVPPPGAPVPASAGEPRVKLPAPQRDRRRAEPKAPPPPSEPRRTRPVAPVRLANLKEVEGGVVLLVQGRRQPGSPGLAINVGTGVEVPAGARAVVEYKDGTWVEVVSGAHVRTFSTGPQGGKAIDLVRGAVRASVTPQPAGSPLVVTGPLAEARVLGTEFTFSIESQGTRLEVREGKVRLTRRRDGASVDVPAGHDALAHATRRLAIRALETDPLVLELEAFGSAKTVKPAEGQKGRLFLEPIAGASNGSCIAAPGVGASVTGPLTLRGGTSTLWVRWRDDLFDSNGEAVSFEVLANGRVVEQITGGGGDKNWKWSPVKFQGKGTLQLTLKSTYKGEVQTAANEDTKKSPYASVVRWDRIILTRDETFVPPNR